MDLALWSSSEQFVGAIVGAALSYLFAVLAVRVAGRRTLTQLSAYDVVVTIAIGSLVASTALPSNASLADGAAILVTFLLLQASISALRQRFDVVRRLIDFRAEVVVSDGAVDLRSAPWTAQLTLSDLESRLRQSGVGDLSQARIAVLEPTGKLTVTSQEVPPALFAQVGKPSA